MTMTFLSETLTCKACQQQKPKDEFYENPRLKGGYEKRCKECYKAVVRKHRAENDCVRVNDRARVRPPSAYNREYELAHPIKYRARTALNNAVNDGKLHKPDTCSECGAGGVIHGHHDDYAFPLLVRWLCARCHSLWHHEHGEGLNG